MKKMIFLFIYILLNADQNITKDELSLKEKGKILYQKHGCYGCHGSDAKGGLTFPKLANQNKLTLIKKLKLYRAGKITSNRASMMKPYAKKLSDLDIEALAVYLNTLPKQKQKYFHQEFEVGDSAGS